MHGRAQKVRTGGFAFVLESQQKLHKQHKHAILSDIWELESVNLIMHCDMGHIDILYWLILS